MKALNLFTKFLLSVLIVLTVCSGNSQAVTQEWAKRYDSGAGGDYAKDIVVDSAGNVIVTGSAGGVDSQYVTVKYNSAGVQQWVRTYNGPVANGDDGAEAIAVDGSDNIYVTGYSLQNSATTKRDIVTIKYDSAGYVPAGWPEIYDSGHQANDQGNDIVVDGSGNVYVTGLGDIAGLGSGNCVTIKYNSAGTLQWATGYPAEYAGTALALNSAATKLYVCSSTILPASGRDYLILKYNTTTGVLIGSQVYDGTGSAPNADDDFAKDIAVDSADNVYVTGESCGGTTIGNTDCVTIKLDSSGAMAAGWPKRYDNVNGADKGTALILDGSANVYVTGASTNLAGNADYLTIMYNTAGVQQWLGFYDDGGMDDYANDVAIDNLGNTYVTGKSKKASGNDYATVMYNSSGTQQWSIRYDGGGGWDSAQAIAVYDSNNIYVTGDSDDVTGNKDYATVKYSQRTGGPDTGDVLKFQQLPLDGLAYENETFYGHDELSTAYSVWVGDTEPVITEYDGCFMADDFADLQDSNVVRIKWWGSYIENEIFDPVTRFLIAFESDMPAGTQGEFSYPDGILSTEVVVYNPTTDPNTLLPGEYSEIVYNAAGGSPCSEKLYEYQAVLAKPFNEDPNVVYWLKIVALVDTPPDPAFWTALFDCLASQQPQLTLCEFFNKTLAEQRIILLQCNLTGTDFTRWGWHNRDYTVMDPYASVPPGVVPGEHLLAEPPDFPVEVWHFQDDAVSGDLQIGPVEPYRMEQWNYNPENYVVTLPYCTGDGFVDGLSGIEFYSKDLAFELYCRAAEPEPVSDLGDAPDSTNSSGVLTMTAYPGPVILANFPTVYSIGSPPYGPLHLAPTAAFYLGRSVTLENEADIGPDQDGINNLDVTMDIPDLDVADDGVAIPLLLPRCRMVTFDYIVTVVDPTQPIYANVWFDWNRDGDWDDIATCDLGKPADEWAVQDQPLAFATPGSYIVTTPPFRTYDNVNVSDLADIWMRITLSETPWTPSASGGSGPMGGYQFGETEDYYFIPDMSCSSCADFDLNGVIDWLDLRELTSNWLWKTDYTDFREADLDCDGDIQFDDFAVLAQQWMSSCP